MTFHLWRCLLLIASASNWHLVLPLPNIITNGEHRCKHGVLNGVPPGAEGQLCCWAIEHLLLQPRAHHHRHASLSYLSSPFGTLDWNSGTLGVRHHSHPPSKGLWDKFCERLPGVHHNCLALLYWELKAIPRASGTSSN